MKLLLLCVAGQSCGLATNKLVVGPPTFPPAEVRTEITADCDGRIAEADYIVLPRARPDASFRIERIAVVRDDVRTAIPKDQLTLSNEVTRIPRPYVERVIPICSESGRFTFRFYLTPSYLVSFPKYIAQGPVTRLDLSIAPDNTITMDVDVLD